MPNPVTHVPPVPIPEVIRHLPHLPPPKLLSGAWAWGGNNSGQLGNGHFDGPQTPTKVNLFTWNYNAKVVDIAAGYSHSLVIVAGNGENSVYACGYNEFGELGYGPVGQNTSLASPVLVQGLPVNIVSIAGGGFHSLALTADGKVYAWGNNTYGQVGDGTTHHRPLPTLVNFSSAPPGTKFVEIAAGMFHSLARTEKGEVYAWGSNDQLQLGEKLLAGKTFSATPVLVKIRTLREPYPPLGPAFLPAHVTAIATRANHSLALSDQGVFAWGDGSLLEKIDLPGEASAIAAGNHTSLVLMKDQHSIYGWGVNQYNQLNLATNGTPITNPTLLPLAPDNAIVTWMAGGEDFVFVVANGSVYGFGHNQYDQIGYPSTSFIVTDPFHPPMKVPITTGNSIKKVVAGFAHGLAIEQL